MLSVRCLSVCDVRALWPNGWTDEDETYNNNNNPICKAPECQKTSVARVIPRVVPS